MDKNFKVRLSVGIAMFAVVMVALYTFHGLPFKVLYILFSIMAFAELVSFLRHKSRVGGTFLVILETVFLIWGAIFVANIDVEHFWYIILGVPGYDIFAYLFGKMLGGKIFKNSRPFPKISKNKTWEGTLFGLATAILLVAILMGVRGAFAVDWRFLFCGPLALIGDLFESYLKRRFEIKDSNEIIIRKGFFSRLEFVVGGSEGHGGFLDRIDSTAFTCTILLIVSSLF